MTDDARPDDPSDDTLHCRRCGREGTADDFDRLLWCEECLAADRSRAAWWGRGLGLAGAALLALWIVLVARPGPEFRILWGLVLIVAYYLFTRLARELVYGIFRVRNHRRMQAELRGRPRA